MATTLQRASHDPIGRTDRRANVTAMAEAAWIASGEPMEWQKLPTEVRYEWTAYQMAAVAELERRVPEVLQLLSK